jgi:hypothetical protein
MTTEDNEMIQTPWGKKRWSTIRQAFEQRDELLDALRGIQLVAEYTDQHEGITMRDLFPNRFAAVGQAIAKATGVPVMAA